MAFLHNHQQIIVAFDFCTELKWTFRMQYCFFVIEQGRRRILHLNALDIQVRNGLFNNCARLFRRPAHTVM